MLHAAPTDGSICSADVCHFGDRKHRQRNQNDDDDVYDNDNSNSSSNSKVLAVQTESGPTVLLSSRTLAGKEGKPLTWDLTVVCPLADSYVATAAEKQAQ